MKTAVILIFSFVLVSFHGFAQDISRHESFCVSGDTTIFTENDQQHVMIAPVYPGKALGFSNDFSDNSRFSGINQDVDDTLKVSFLVTKKGKVRDVKLLKKSDVKKANRRMKRGIKRLRRFEKPARIDGKPCPYRMVYTLNLTVNFENRFLPNR